VRKNWKRSLAYIEIDAHLSLSLSLSLSPIYLYIGRKQVIPQTRGKRFLSTTFLNTIHYANTEAECQQTSLLLRSKSPCCTGLWTKNGKQSKNRRREYQSVSNPAGKKASCTAESVMSRKNPTKK
jgi:hypothetical protein